MMALSSIHDVANHEHHFRPNPDAKPFIPNPFPVPGSNWHFYSNENGKSVNGFLPPIWLHPQVDHENLLVAGSSANSSKKHIAFHLVSNVLDDEVLEDASKEHISVSYSYPSVMQKDQNTIYNRSINSVIDSWHTSPSDFTLHIDPEQTSSDKSSINNKSIHEIWSPDPSPNELNNLSPNEEVLTSYNHLQQQQQQQLLDSPNSIIDSPDVSFEQVQTDMISHQIYSEMEARSGTDSTNQFCYPNLSSPIYQHYNYRNIQPGPPQAEMYTATIISPRNTTMIDNNIQPVVVEPGGYYPNPHYVNRYEEGQHGKRRARREPLTEIVYETKMSCVEELSISLDECRDQLRHLERDYRKADLSLSQEFRLRKSSLGEGTQFKYPSNSTRVDKLIVEQQREHQKIESLIGRIERLGFTPMHPNVGLTVDLWLTAIKDLRNTRKNELANINECQGLPNNAAKSHTQSDVYNLVASVKELTKLTRSARTIVWCAMQMLYANNLSVSGE